MVRSKKDARGSGYGRARSGILLRVTILVSVVVVLAGVASYFLLRSNQQNLADECVESLVKMEASNFSTSYSYMGQLLFPEYIEKFKDLDEADLFESLQQGETSELQELLNEDMEGMVESGFMGLEEILVFLPPSFMISQPLVIAGSEETLIRDFEMPDDITKGIEDGSTFCWRENGVPELGLEDNCLVSIGYAESPLFPGICYAYLGFKPMREELDAIDSFYQDRMDSANMMLMIVLEGSVFAILLIVFLLLNYLIRRRITEPIVQLSEAADELMRGNLDVEVEVHPGGDFEALETAFSEMVKSLRGYIARSVGQEAGPGKDARKNVARSVARRARILWDITGIMVVVMLITGLLTFFVLRRSQNSLLDDTVDLMIETEAKDFRSSLDYTVAISFPSYVEEFDAASVQEMLLDLNAGRISGLQETVIEDIEVMVSSGYHGVEKVLLVVPPSTVSPDFMIWASNDEELVYSRELPQELVEAIEEEKPYIIMEEGVSQLGMNSEFLVTFNQVDNPLMPTMPFHYVAIKPLPEEISSIREFCSRQRAEASLYLAGILVGSILLVILITFFLLNHMLTRRITRPVEELSAAAERVMQGDLDVQVEVEEGGSLESLQRAFNEMVESLRRYIIR